MNTSARVRRTSVLPQGKTLEQTEFTSGCSGEIRVPAKRSFVGRFITCCEEDRLGTLQGGRVFHVAEGRVI